jgi:dTMP kinase
MTSGVFISLDGLDGCGKSTQCRLLADWLRRQGWAVTTCVDPGGTPLGQQLRKIVLEQRGAVAMAAEALVFMASRAQLVAEVIRPALESGQAVVSDRFLLANVVYQGHAGGLDPEQLWEVGKLSSGGLEPDLTIVLDLPPELAETRRARPADRIESRGPDYHRRVREGFLAEARRRPGLIKVIDTSAAPQAVQAHIQQEVARVLATRPRA